MLNHIPTYYFDTPQPGLTKEQNGQGVAVDNVPFTYHLLRLKNTEIADVVIYDDGQITVHVLNNSARAVRELEKLTFAALRAGNNVRVLGR